MIIEWEVAGIRGTHYIRGDSFLVGRSAECALRVPAGPNRDLLFVRGEQGFADRAQAGSHQRYRHLDGRRVTISFHRPSDTFPPKTLRRIVEEQARWSADDLRRLKVPQ